MAFFNYSIRRFLWSPWAIPVSILFSFFWGLGSIPLFDLDEGAFTEATREMLETGIYSATYLDGEPRYDKPILFYWLQALSIKSFGFNEWAFRLPSVVMAALWSWALYCFAREFIGKRRAQIATLMMINSVWVALIARSAIADATLNVFLSLAMFDIWRYFSNQKPKYAWRVYLWMALGTLAKGPIAVAVPLVASLTYLIVSRESLDKYKAYFNPIGWIIYLLTVTPWVIAVSLEQGDGFFQGFIVEHNLKRFSSTRESHGGTPFYYFATLPLILLPLSGLLFIWVRNAIKGWQKPLERFLTIWFVLIFVLFSFSKTQLPHYILNGCVPLFILFAMGKGLHKRHYWLFIFPVLIAILLFALPTIIELAAKSTGGYDGALMSRHNEVFDHLYSGSGILLLVCLGLAIIFPRLQNWQRLVACGLALNLFVFTAFVRVASDMQQQPVHEIIQYLEDTAPDETVVAFRMHMPSFSVYRGKITPLRAPQAGELAITRVDRLKELNEALEGNPIKILFQSGGLVLLRALPPTE